MGLPATARFKLLSRGGQVCLFVIACIAPTFKSCARLRGLTLCILCIHTNTAKHARTHASRQTPPQTSNTRAQTRTHTRTYTHIHTLQVYRVQGPEDSAAQVPFVTVRQINRPFFDGLGELLTFTQPSALKGFECCALSRGLENRCTLCQVREGGVFSHASALEGGLNDECTNRGQRKRGKKMGGDFHEVELKLSYYRASVKIGSQQDVAEKCAMFL